MAVDPQFMVDNSAWNRIRHASVRARLRPLVDACIVATCGAIEVEALYSARNADDHDRLRVQRSTIFTYLDTAEADWRRALDIQHLLAKRSEHRGPRVPDLLIAAVAERYGLTLLHYDSDFERIATVSGQLAEWVVPRKSVP